MDLKNMREHYERGALQKGALPDNPFNLFGTWLHEAKEANIPEPNAMTLATATLNARPSARIVLLKEFSEEGFVFYTNYQSRKAEELAKNPQATLLFLWLQMERQVRIEGLVTKISEEESAAYFRSRPKGSQIGAMASDQSKPIESREKLEAKLSALETEFGDAAEIPKPAHWGGYILKPTEVEFWQGRPNRLHDRIVYHAQAESTWQKVRLQP